jgi:hypothetical protein
MISCTIYLNVRGVTMDKWRVETGYLHEKLLLLFSGCTIMYFPILSINNGDELPKTSGIYFEVAYFPLRY